MIKQAKQVLKQTFGYDEFRPLQEDVISDVLNKKDTLVIMPTGGGKSLCYQIPAILFDGLTIVISPLISLMKDQVEQLDEYGVPALFLNSTLTPEQYAANVQKLKNREVKLLYLAPETLMMESTRELLDKLNVDCFTIDEAHCISEWGHDFRPEYRQLAKVRKYFPDAVCLALTATATPRVREDIRITLEMNKTETYVASFDRKNLLLQVVDKQDPLEQILDFLYTRPKQSGIIYCFSRRQVNELYSDLKLEGHSVLPYHAGLSEAQRTRNQEAFIRDNAQIIVATIAFGMGINKPDVRFVVHHDMPQNIESYYQQIGRAGRDGLQADCMLLYSYSDKQKIQYFINQKEGDEKKIAEQHLDAILNFMEYDDCRRKPLLEYFGEEYQHEECGMCDNCLKYKDNMQDYTEQAQKYMSCIARTEETYGAYYIADILRGSKQKKILKNGHDKLSTYGIGQEWTKNQWIQLSRLLLRKDLLKKDPDHGSLKLTTGSSAVLKGDERVEGILDRTQATSDEDKPSRTSTDVENKHNADLFEKLRAKRKELADEQEIPPYAIFPDTTLMEMSFYFPQDDESLMAIYGVGSVKMKKYGDDFLPIIKEFTQNNEVEERTKAIKKKVKKTTEKKKYELVGEEFNQNKSVEHLAEQFGVKEVTILSNLKKYLDDGNKIDPDGILEASSLSQRKIDEVYESMDKVGADILKPVYEDLDKTVDYGELRVLQLAYLAENR
ncbi:DNA helicase RecQ [Rhodohalobacter sp.]|uniref:DNA helicase RecQ n=1 Tax=Rhodohalobacter sp. TaxID=1974210 RepID=UPI0035613367